MKKFFAAFLMLVLFVGQALAQAGSASALSATAGIPVATAAPADVAAMPLEKRVCWRKTLTAVRGDTRPLAPPPCSIDVKNTCEARLAVFPANRQAYAPVPVLRLTGSGCGGPFRPPIA